MCAFIIVLINTKRFNRRPANTSKCNKKNSDCILCYKLQTGIFLEHGY